MCLPRRRTHGRVIVRNEGVIYIKRWLEGIRVLPLTDSVLRTRARVTRIKRKSLRSLGRHFHSTVYLIHFLPQLACAVYAVLEIPRPRLQEHLHPEQLAHPLRRLSSGTRARYTNEKFPSGERKWPFLRSPQDGRVSWVQVVK